MDLVVGGQQFVDIAAGEEVGCAVWPLGDRELPVMADGRLRVTGNALRFGATGVAQREGIPGGQGTSRRTAEPAEGESGCAAQEVRNLDAAGDQYVDPHAGVGRGTHRQRAARGNGDGTPLGDRPAVEGHRCRCASHADKRVFGETQGGTGERRLQSRGALGVADGLVAEPERQVVHRAGRWHTHLPVPGASGPVLHRREHAGRGDRHGAHALSTTIRTGVGSNPLHGLLICGQFDTSTRVSTSARSLIFFPGAERPSTIPSVPSSSTGTFI